MPVEAYIKIVEQTFAHHVDLSPNGFFSRRTIKANSSLKLPILYELFHSHGCPKAAGSKQVVSAAMTSSTLLQWFFCWLCLLRNARQRIILSHDTDDRFARSELCYECVRHTRNTPRYFEALGFGIIREDLR